MRKPCTVTALLLALSLPGATQAAPDVPKRKSGLWEITTAMQGMPQGMTMQQCVDEKTDDMIRQQGSGREQQPKCAKQDIKRDGDRTIVDSVCDMGGTTATTRAVFSGRFDSNYRADIKSAYNPPMHGMKESQVSIQAKWLGACKAGQKPGDIIMPNGMMVNPGTMPKNAR